MDEILLLNVKGRDSLTAKTRADAAGVLIRLDDEGRPDWWAELRLGEADLVLLLAATRRASGPAEEPSDDVAIVDKNGQPLFDSPTP